MLDRKALKRIYVERLLFTDIDSQISAWTEKTSFQTREELQIWSEKLSGYESEVNRIKKISGLQASNYELSVGITCDDDDVCRPYVRVDSMRLRSCQEASFISSNKVFDLYDDILQILQS